MSICTTQSFYVNKNAQRNINVDIKTLDCKHWHHLKFILKNWDLLPKMHVSYSDWKHEEAKTLAEIPNRQFQWCGHKQIRQLQSLIVDFLNLAQPIQWS